MTDKPTLVGQDISGCEILNKVAEGGMGAVYKARHKALNRTVCVKILSPALANDKKAVELFLTEARAIAELDHPNIVNVYNVGKEKGYYFIVMSFIEGQTLSMMLKKNKVLPIGLVLDLFEGVLKGLEAAHDKGIIHRDIKPSNILINPQMQPKVVDFGIAKKVDKEKGSTKTTELAGTAYFIAPEQALGRDLDVRADLYSIGASLYYVLTGHFPYNGKNTIDIIQKHINDPVPDPSKLRKDLPPWLSLAIQKLMSKNPDNRFQTARETYQHFHKMRVDESFRLQTGTSGKAIDLGVETGLKIVKEEKLSTDYIKKQRAEEAKQIAQRTSTSSRMASQMPSLDAAPDEATPAKPKPVVQPAPVNPKPQTQPVQTPASQMAMAETVRTKAIFEKMNENNKSVKVKQAMFFSFKQLLRLITFVPLFMAFAAGIIYVFYTLGKISSVHTSAAEGLISNIIAPLSASQYEPNQMLFTVLGLFTIGFIFASSSIKAFARSTATLLILGFISYLAGLFVPDIPFMDTGKISQFLFTPSYILCFLVLAVTWCVSLALTYNRSISQGILGASLVILSLTLAYLSTKMTLLPDMNTLLTKVMLYGSLAGGLITLYYFLARSERNTIFTTFILFVASLAGIWAFSVSGLADSTLDTVQALTDRIEVKAITNRDSIVKSEELVGLKTARRSFASVNKANELSAKTPEARYAFLEEKIKNIAGESFTEENLPVYISFLSRYYTGGESKMKFYVWDYALSYPVNNFNTNAKENGAYFFLLLMLYVLGTLSCAGTIIFGDEL